MKIVTIYGSPRQGITYQSVQLIKAEMQKQGKVEFIEFHLPKDVPVFCKGCFQCFQKGESTCPDTKHIQPILEAMMEADGFIFSTPVYALHISGALKAFLDHMAFCYINHRPRFYKQKALVLTTTAGAGIGNCNKYIAQNLAFWGVNKVYTVGAPMMAARWSEVSPRIMAKSTKVFQKAGRIFYQDLASKKFHQPSFIQTIMFHVSRSLMLSYRSSLDKDYWQEKGWLDKRAQYFTKEIKPTILKKIVGKVVEYLFTRFVIVKQ